jgi:hypothetical protein
MGQSFTTAAGPRKRSHSRVRVPRDSWPHFSVSYSRLPQPGGPGPRIYILLGTGWPRHWVPFSSPPRLARLRWRYDSTQSPHESQLRKEFPAFYKSQWFSTVVRYEVSTTTITHTPSGVSDIRCSAEWIVTDVSHGRTTSILRVFSEPHTDVLKYHYKLKSWIMPTHHSSFILIVPTSLLLFKSPPPPTLSLFRLQTCALKAMTFDYRFMLIPPLPWTGSLQICFSVIWFTKL